MEEMKVSKNFIIQELAQKLDRQIPLRQMANLCKELIREDRDVRLLQASSGEDVHDLVGDDCSRDDLPDGEVQFFVCLALTGHALGQHGPHGLEEAHVVPDAQCLVVGHGERKSLGELSDRAQESRLAILVLEDVLLRGGQQR